MVPKTFKWCVEGNGNIHLGTSKCDSTYTSSEELIGKSKRNVPLRQHSSSDSTDYYNHLATMIRHCSITNHLNNIAKTLHNPVTTGLFDWFKEKLWVLGYLIFEFVLLCLETVISLLITCLKSICKSFFNRTTINIMYSTAAQPVPPVEENSDFFVRN